MLEATADEEKGFQGANTVRLSSTVSPAAIPRLCSQRERCCYRSATFKPAVGVVTRRDQNSRCIQEWLSARCDEDRSIRITKPSTGHAC